MISEKMRGYVENSSAIRAMFEEGKRWQISSEQKMYTISASVIRMCRHLPK